MDEEKKPNCCCKEWADRLGSIRFYDMAVTFDCPEHGRITLDKRYVPAPIPERSRRYPLRQRM